MAFKASDRRHHAVEFIRNPVGSYFHSQVYIFMRLKDLLDFTCMIADKFSKDAKVKLTLFQNIG